MNKMESHGHYSEDSTSEKKDKNGENEDFDIAINQDRIITNSYS